MVNEISDKHLEETIEFWDKWLNRNKTANVAEFMVYGGRSLDACKELAIRRRKPVYTCKNCKDYSGFEDGVGEPGCE